ncbi:hypothetical protein B0I35DRAFT_49073 [Stachybotrys elegans]|uniref:BZIP domain-containing protein n=1 Tax=Stachybotrys elegans TaxID=80388 RepID=A0A8K0SRE9_9HYPO|nr:hypothetical protein B0I35DRAFT_49073 [Stachybotrys elegans]
MSASVAQFPRKRQKTTGDDGDEQPKKKQRGRPRLNPTDENPDAIERRRTQIRLAQRNYRQRKDLTILNLEQRVKILELGNSQITHALQAFFNTVISLGLLTTTPELARPFGELNSTFSRVKQDLDKRIQDIESPVVDQVSQASPPPVVPPQPAPITPKVSNWTPPQSVPFSTPGSFSPLFAGSSPPVEAVTIHPTPPPAFDAVSQPTETATAQPTPAFEVIAQPTIHNASFPLDADFLPQEMELDMDFDKDMAIPSPLDIISLPAPPSYSFMEETFGRRFHRCALETGLRLVTSPCPPPGALEAVFGFCLLYETKGSIIKRLMTGLRRGRYESLNHWKAPFTNLGGSGFVFPDEQTSATGRGTTASKAFYELYKPQIASGFSMGPFDGRTESVRETYLDADYRIQYPGFEGEFYDPNEVERYLQDRGIFIPASADYIDAEINIDDFSDHSDDSEQQRGATDTAADGSWPNDELSTEAAGIVTTSGLSAMATQALDHSLPLSTETNDEPTFYCPLFPDKSWRGRGPKLVKITINVRTLINELIDHTVCLGRAPGIREVHIAQALKVAAGLLPPSPPSSCSAD